MNRICTVLVFTCIVFAGCKKGNKTDSINNTPGSNNFFPADTSVIFHTGLIASTADELRQIPLLETFDTTKIPITGRVSAPGKTERVTATSFELTDFPKAGDQGDNESCIGWALGYGAMGYMYRQLEKDPQLDLSPSFIWNSINGGKNEGNLSLVKAMQFAQEKGDCLRSKMPEQTPFDTKPGPDQLDNALDYTASDIIRFGSINIELIKAMLRRKKPVVFTMLIDVSFQYGSLSKNDDPKRYWQKTQDGRWVWYNTTVSNPNVPSLVFKPHALVLTGYDDDPNVKAFKFQNSWKKEILEPEKYHWTPGDKDGNAWITYELFQKVVLKNDAGPELFMVIPRVATVKSSDPSYNKVSLSGEVYNTGFFIPKERGFCVSKNKGPTVNDQSVKESGGAGTLVLNIENLEANTTYYYRAYASDGSRVLYSNQGSFKTMASPTLIQTINYNIVSWKRDYHDSNGVKSDGTSTTGQARLDFFSNDSCSLFIPGPGPFYYVLNGNYSGNQVVIKNMINFDGHFHPLSSQVTFSKLDQRVSCIFHIAYSPYSGLTYFEDDPLEMTKE